MNRNEDSKCKPNLYLLGYLTLLSVRIKICDDGILIVIVFVDIVRCPVFYLKHNVSETGFSLHLQVKAYSVGANR
jgi:hypothetical protein